jgi:hypothetical protein
MPRDNVFDRFRKNLARAAEAAGTTPDRIVDAALFDERPAAKPRTGLREAEAIPKR